MQPRKKRMDHSTVAGRDSLNRQKTPTIKPKKSRQKEIKKIIFVYQAKVRVSHRWLLEERRKGRGEARGLVKEAKKRDT